MEFETVNLLTLILVTFFVTEGLKSLSRLLGVDLSGYAAAITASLVALIVGIFQAVLVPVLSPEVASLVEPVAHLLVAILAAFGLHKTAVRFSK